ncbi:FecCD family ABC transporter permease [Actinomyces viscosus]|uniref:Ferric enterobactin transport system permease protein fepD n=1 Tax=Actinomyces viscosus TaxID=1656 RepID=A0A3S4V4C6_ACTVI|nr:iron chelate uptake ABC transporter family permease subunit [Actinomyces viscosus]VEI18616.1 Ferric enterobactin transport system permease protein fepD [Actinomyces viscosus]
MSEEDIGSGARPSCTRATPPGAGGQTAGTRPGPGPRPGRPLILLAAAALLAASILASLLIGSSKIPADQVVHYLLHPDASNVSYNINVLRVQRTLIGLLVGAALAVAGAVMQAVTRNPLAEPGLLGVNAGASLGIVLGTAALGVLPVPGQLALAAGGALAATALVQVIGMIGSAVGGAGGGSPVRLVLIGVAFSAFAEAVIRGVVLTMPNLFRTFIDWEVGSLTRADIPLPAMAALVLLGIGAALLLAGALDNIALGDDVAAALGTRVGLVRAASLAVITVLCATATTVAGPIGFVGLMAPLTASWLMGPHRGWIVALCALVGPAVVLAADVLGRVLARPGEMQVGLLTAFVGSPVLLLMVLRMKDRAS